MTEITTSEKPRRGRVISFHFLVFFLLISGSFLFVGVGKAWAATYYVANAGNDNCDGTSQTIGTSGHCAWQTIAHVNAQTFSPGDSILFNKGDTWREELIPPSSGSAGNPITFGAYGTGAQPAILGSTQITSGWSNSNISSTSGDILHETFDATGSGGYAFGTAGAGYLDNTGWVGTLGSGSVLDADNTDISDSQGGSSQILKVQKVSPNYNSQAVKTYGSAKAITYFTGYVYVSADGLASDGNSVYLFSEENIPAYGYNWRMWLYNGSGTIKFEFGAYYNGTTNYMYSGAVSTGQWYKIDVKYDITNKAYEWRINGISQNSGSLPGTLLAGPTQLNIGDQNNSYTLTAYFDSIDVNDSGYVTQPIALPSNVWWNSVAVAPLEIWFNNGGTIHWGIPETTLASVTAPYEWYANNGYLFVYSTADPGTAYTLIEASQRSAGVTAYPSTTIQYITVNGLSVSYTGGAGIQTGIGTIGWNIINNSVSYIGLKGTFPGDGIYVRGGGTLVSGNTVHDAGVHGVWVLADGAGESVSTVIVKNNTIYNCYHTDIDIMDILGSLSNVVVEYNLLYSTSSYDTTYTSRGIYISGQSPGVTINNVTAAYNIIYNYCDEGILVGGSSGTEENISVYNNVIYGPLASCGQNTWGVNLQNTIAAGTNSFENNIVAQSNYSSGSAPVYIATSSQITNLNNNLYWLIGSTGYPVSVNGTGYSSQSTYRSAMSPQESATLFANPLFTDGSGSYSLATDFMLQPLSPAIDAGTPVGLTTDYTGTNLIYGAPDIGAYESQPPYTFSSNNIPTTGSTRLYANGQYQMLTASSTSAIAHFSVTPVGGYYTPSTSQYMDLSINTWTTADKNWTASSTSGAYFTHATSTVYTIGDLAPSASYVFHLDSATSTALTSTQCSGSLCTADGSGNLVFTYTGGYSSHTFDLSEDVAPSISSVSSPTTPSTNKTPSFSFTSSEAGTLLYAGSCTPTSTSVSSGSNSFTFNSLSDGTYSNCAFSVIDASGNDSATTTLNSFLIDTTGPTGSITNASGSPTNSVTPTLNLTIADSGVGTTGAQMRLSCDGSTWSSWQPYATPVTTFNIDTGPGCSNSDGTKTVYVEYEDSLNNVGSSYNTGAFTLDTTNPNAELSGYPGTYGSYASSTAATITVAGTDVVNYEYKLDSGSYGASTPVATPITLSGLSEGSHTISVIGETPSGTWQSQSSPTTYTWIIDTTGPTGSISNASGNPTNSLTPTLNLTIADSGVGIASAQMRFSCNNSTWSSWTAYATPVTTFNVDTGAGCTNSDGTKTVYAQYTDSLGNTSSTYNTGAFTLDTVSKTATLSNTPATYGIYTASNTTNITVAGTGVSSYEYKLDSGSYGTETPIASPIALSSLSEGPHTLSVIGKDAAGNWQSQSSPTTYSWTVDQTGPVFSFFAPVNAGSMVNFGSFSWAATDALSGVASYALTLDGSTTTGLTIPSYTPATPFACSSSHTWAVRAFDNVGNYTDSGTLAMTASCPGGSSSYTPPPPTTVSTTTTATTPTPPPATTPDLSSTQIQSILSLLASFGADAATIANVQTALGGAPTPSTTSTHTTYTFTRNLSLHSTGADVKALQQFLNSHGFIVAATGPGSPGNETTTFGMKTYQALIKYQKSVGLPGTGWFGPIDPAPKFQTTFSTGLMGLAYPAYEATQNLSGGEAANYQPH